MRSGADLRGGSRSHFHQKHLLQHESNDLISRAFREIYEYLDGGTELSGGESDTRWDEYGMPTSRTERHGTTGKGLFMWADPKVSGHGAHGESAR